MQKTATFAKKLQNFQKHLDTFGKFRYNIKTFAPETARCAGAQKNLIKCERCIGFL